MKAPPPTNKRGRTILGQKPPSLVVRAKEETTDDAPEIREVAAAKVVPQLPVDSPQLSNNTLTEKIKKDLSVRTDRVALRKTGHHERECARPPP